MLSHLPLLLRSPRWMPPYMRPRAVFKDFTSLRIRTCLFQSSTFPLISRFVWTAPSFRMGLAQAYCFCGKVQTRATIKPTGRSIHCIRYSPQVWDYVHCVYCGCVSLRLRVLTVLNWLTLSMNHHCHYFQIKKKHSMYQHSIEGERSLNRLSDGVKHQTWSAIFFI